MDLKDVISNVYANAAEAHAAFHAGHNEKAEEYLATIENEIGQYITENPTPAGDVTKSATSEKPADEQTEKPAEVPGAALPATQFVSSAEDQKKALDQAGP